MAVGKIWKMFCKKIIIGGKDRRSQFRALQNVPE
jgi:hypothetical protein